MCGITGLYNYGASERDERPDLCRMRDTMAHRGPDGCRTWAEDEIGLAHNLLWTTPESLRESQPLASRSLILARRRWTYSMEMQQADH